MEGSEVSWVELTVINECCRHIAATSESNNLNKHNGIHFASSMKCWCSVVTTVKLQVHFSPKNDLFCLRAQLAIAEKGTTQSERQCFEVFQVCWKSRVYVQHSYQNQEAWRSHIHCYLRFDIFFFLSVSSKKFHTSPCGGFRESNSGPLAPEASIMPLNQIPVISICQKVTI